MGFITLMQKLMRNVVTNTILLLIILSVGFSYGQNKKSPKAAASNQVDDLNIDIKYSSPSVRGRTVWGDLVPYDKVWRTGADNATTIEFNKPVTVNGQALGAGKYAFFTIPGKDEWVVIFNNNPDQWGAYKYDQKQDALRIKVKPMEVPMQESMKFEVSKTGLITLSWEKKAVQVQVKQSKPGQ